MFKLLKNVGFFPDSKTVQKYKMNSNLIPNTKLNVKEDDGLLFSLIFPENLRIVDHSKKFFRKEQDIYMVYTT